MVLFGPSGCGDEFYSQGHKSILEIPKWIKDNGLDCFEYSVRFHAFASKCGAAVVQRTPQYALLFAQRRYVYSICLLFDAADSGTRVRPATSSACQAPFNDRGSALCHPGGPHAFYGATILL